ncbi:MAG: Hsp20/alpha crystallin family protein [Nannocystaceae bacterium]
MSEPTLHSHATKTPSEPASERLVVAPAVDIFENQDGYLVLADLPGVDGDAIDVRFEEGELRLAARRDFPGEEGRLGGEFRAAEYRRVFRIPEDVDAAGIEAGFKGGVLSLRLPKSKQAKPRKIAVTAAKA